MPALNYPGTTPAGISAIPKRFVDPPIFLLHSSLSLFTPPATHPTLLASNSCRAHVPTIGAMPQANRGHSPS